MVGNLSSGDHVRETRIRFRNITEFEHYIKSIEDGYDAEHAIFSGYIYKINAPQFNLVIRSQYGIRCDFKREIWNIEVIFVLFQLKDFVLSNVLKYSNGEDYKQQFLVFFRNEKRQSKMTNARIQPFSTANNINLGYSDGILVFPRMVTERNIALYLHNDILCLIWKSKGVSFNKALEELERNFKVVDNLITGENVISLFKYEFIPTKNDSHLTSFLVYDLETHKTGGARPYFISMYRLSKLAGKYNRDLAPYEIENCKRDTLVFDGEFCISNALDFLLNFKGEEWKIKTKIVE